MHEYTVSRFSGPLRAAIFDWSGTVVDHGCFAPAEVFIETFARRGIAVTWQQARAPMGLAKLDHIRAILSMPEIAAEWRAVTGRDWREEDARELFAATLEVQIAATLRHATLIAGAAETVAACRERGLAIGSTTGYARAIMDALAPVAARQGFAPDAIICPDDVRAGRPAPWMLFRAAEQLNVYPPAAIVKVGDTVPDVAEGVNAGAWSVAVSRTGNEAGLSAAEAATLAPAELAARLAPITARLRAAGAHYVIESVAELPAVIDEISRRLQRGENPYESLPHPS